MSGHNVEHHLFILNTCMILKRQYYRKMTDTLGDTFLRIFINNFYDIFKIDRFTKASSINCMSYDGVSSVIVNI